MALKKLESVDYIVVHCSATPPDMDIGRKEIDKWHRQRKFKKIGYHFVIRRDGTIEWGRNIDTVGAHAYGVNQNSIGVCLVGGVDNKQSAEDNFEEIQKKALKFVLRFLLHEFPQAEVIGHRDVPGTNKACPSFDVKTWWSAVNTPVGELE